MTKNLKFDPFNFDGLEWHDETADVDGHGQPRKIEVVVPPYFADDHANRDLPTGKDLGHGRKGWHLLVSVAEWAEWVSDATYYSDCAGQGWDIENGLQLQASARATVKRLKALAHTIEIDAGD